MQIRSRLTLQFAMLVGGILLVAFLSLYFVVLKHNDEEFFKRLREKAITSAILLLKVEKVDSALLKTIDLSKRDVLFRENISVFNEERKTIYTNNDTLDFIVSDAQFNQIKAGAEQMFFQNDFDILGTRFRDRGQNYVIIAGAIDIDGHARMEDLKNLLIVLYLVMIAIVAVSGWVYAGRALKPIQKIMSEVQSISTIDLSRRLHGDDKPDEIGKLVSIFNGLLGRLENAFTLQKTFVSNVSHELKNPLTKITSQLEVTLFNERKTEEYRETIQSVLDDIKELNHLSSSLLDLASLHQDNRSFTMSRVRIDEVLWEVRENVQIINSSYKVDIHTVTMPENEEDLYLNANPYLLKTAIKNLIENACKFSEDHTATVSLICSGEKIEIRVFDNGPGIEHKELQNVFQPFYRTNNTSQVKGYGIGLSLSQKIVSIHNGTIEIDSKIGQGTLVSAIFYLHS
jgi:Signal transduction histidine kinase